MPQLDRIIIFSQIFWLFIIFTFSYIILTHFFLPKFLKSIKSRKLTVNTNSKEISDITSKFSQKQLLQKQLLLKNLVLIESFITTDFTSLDLKQNQVDTKSISKKVGSVSTDATLYCSNQLLNSIFLYPRSLNLKGKIL